MSQSCKGIRGWLVAGLVVAPMALSGCGLMNSMQDPPDDDDDDQGLCAVEGACPAPERVDVEARGLDSLTIEWSAVEGATGYQIEWEDGAGEARGERVGADAGEYTVDGLARPEVSAIENVELAIDDEEFRITWEMDESEFEGADEVEIDVRGLFGEEEAEGSAGRAEGRTFAEVTAFEVGSEGREMEVSIGDSDDGDGSGYVYTQSKMTEEMTDWVVAPPQKRRGVGVASKPYELVPVPDIALEMGVEIGVQAIEEGGEVVATGQGEGSWPRFDVDTAQIDYAEEEDEKEEPRASELGLVFDDRGELNMGRLEEWDDEPSPVNAGSIYARLVVDEDLGWDLDWVELSLEGPEVFFGGGDRGKNNRQMEEVWREGETGGDWMKVLATAGGGTVWLESSMVGDSPHAGNQVEKLDAEGDKIWESSDDGLAVVDMVVAPTGDVYGLAAEVDEGALKTDQFWVFMLDGEDGEVYESVDINPSGFSGTTDVDGCVPEAIEADDEGQIYVMCDDLDNPLLMHLIELTEDNNGWSVTNDQSLNLGFESFGGMVLEPEEGQLVVVGETGGGLEASWFEVGEGQFPENPSITGISDVFGSGDTTLNAMSGPNEQGQVWAVVSDGDGGRLVLMYDEQITEFSGVDETGSVQLGDITALEVGPGGVLYASDGGSLGRWQADGDVLALESEVVSIGSGAVQDLAVTPGRRGVAGGLWEVSDFGGW